MEKRLIACTITPIFPGNSQCIKTTKMHASPIKKPKQELYCFVFVREVELLIPDKSTLPTIYSRFLLTNPKD